MAGGHERERTSSQKITVPEMLTERHHKRSEQGAAMVELALVLPLLLMLVMGIIFFGLAYNAKVELTGAVREGARALALGKTRTSSSTCDPNLAPADAECLVRQAAPALNSGIKFPANSVDTPQVDCGTDQAKITAQYDLAYTIPFVSSGTWTIQATGVMRCGL